MNNYIIDPWVLYLIFKAKDIVVGIALISLLAQPLAYLYSCCIDEHAEEFYKNYCCGVDDMKVYKEYKRQKRKAYTLSKSPQVFAIIFLITMFASFFMPDKEEATALYLASKVDKETTVEVYKDIKTEILNIIRDGVTIAKESK